MSPPSKQQKASEFDYVLFISAAAILGSCLRVFMARFFGEDCEEQSVNDFLTPLASYVCLTSNGRTSQTGGALFRDLPANVFGSFIMGLISTKKIKIPWYHKDHPAQADDVHHASLSVGFCGCLTTFASWNSQMVVMMDGTFTELGPQVFVALCGYLIGFMAATHSFQAGREMALILYYLINGEESSSDPIDNVEQQQPQEEIVTPNFWCLKPKVFLLVPALILLPLFFVGDVMHGHQFYRNMFVLWFASPLGALLRWKLSTWNDPKNRSILTDKFSWLPVGTLTANLVGCIVSIVCTVLLDANTMQYETYGPWGLAALVALKSGFAGSLSTVSSMAKEIVFLTDDHPGHLKSRGYAFITSMSAMLLGLMIYMPIGRMA